MMSLPMNDTEGLRLDKWLWAARFFKTRRLATDAIKSGKVDLNKTKAKPSKVIYVGDNLKIRQGDYDYEIEVKAITPRRGPATEAQKLYVESELSLEKRLEKKELLKAESASRPKFPGRPSKRERRKIIKFVQNQYDA